MARPATVLTLIASALGAIACSPRVGDQTAAFAPGRAASSVSATECRFPSEPIVVTAQDGAVLQYWEVESRALWWEPVLPTETAYARYRSYFEEMGAVLARPAQVVPEDQRLQENWRRELHNVERAYSSEAGTVRPIHCLEALLFAFQNARHSQLDHPTEFIASVLRKPVAGKSMLRVYFGAGADMFPPREVYGFDRVERDLADGWTYVAMLHNHTVQNAAGVWRLGVPAPSASDVQLLNSLDERFALERAWVTNGFFTLDLSAEDLRQYLGPE